MATVADDPVARRLDEYRDIVAAEPDGPGDQLLDRQTFAAGCAWAAISMEVGFWYMEVGHNERPPTEADSEMYRSVIAEWAAITEEVLMPRVARREAETGVFTDDDRRLREDLAEAHNSLDKWQPAEPNRDFSRYYHQLSPEEYATLQRVIAEGSARPTITPRLSQ